MYEETLKKLDLTKEQALIYETLLKNGPMPARKITLKTGIKRGFTYKNLDQLESLELIEKQERDGKVTIFKPNHPNQLINILENRKKQVDLANESIRQIIGQMTSDFNMISGAPNIKYYEGLSGLKEILEDTLYAKEEILAYSDLESIEKYVKKENEWYVNEREKYNIKKRGLVLGTEFNIKFLKDYHVNITNNRILPLGSEPFKTVMQIYDDKVSYITFIENLNEDPVQIIGVLITNPAIAELHKKLFEFNWANSREIIN